MSLLYKYIKVQLKIKEKEMKTIFKGTVNGKEFNDVKAYNEALLKVINSGEPVKATSRTESEDENVEPEEDFGYLDPSKDIYKDGFLYADRLVNGDEEDDAWAYANERDRLEARLGEILDTVNEKQADIDVAALTERYKAAIDDVKGDSDRNQATIKSLCKKIEQAEKDFKDLEGQLKVAHHAKIVIDLYKDHFANVVEALQEWLETPVKDHDETPDAPDEGCESGRWDCGRRDCKGKVEYSKKGIYDEIMKLMREIFK